MKVWQKARLITIEIHKMTLELPKYELYETESQIRRFSKSIRSNIVEGYGRRKYKADYIKFLIYSHSSVDETRVHLETLFETGSLTDKTTFLNLSENLDQTGKMPYKFIKSIENRDY